jgi:hypothetical protein
MEEEDGMDDDQEGMQRILPTRPLSAEEPEQQQVCVCSSNFLLTACFRWNDAVLSAWSSVFWCQRAELLGAARAGALSSQFFSAFLMLVCVLPL